jgi:lysophospholipase L1-like esterase
MESVATAVRDYGGMIGYFFSAVLTCLSLLWFHTNRGLALLMMTGKGFKTSPTFHKILVIGDGVAEGVGDRIAMGSEPGVVPKLQRIIDSSTGRLRHRWQVSNLGLSFSTLADWLPTATAFPKADYLLWRLVHKFRDPTKKGKNLFESVTQDDRWQDAEVAVLMFGTDEVHADTAADAKNLLMRSSTTADEIMALASGLEKHGMRVFVCTLQLPLSYQDPKYQHIKVRNEAIKSAVAKAVADGGDDATIRLGFDLGSLTLRRTLHFTSDAANYNPSGYKNIAEGLMETVRNTLVAVEWTHIKKLID